MGACSGKCCTKAGVPGQDRPKLNLLKTGGESKAEAAVGNPAVVDATEPAVETATAESAKDANEAPTDTQLAGTPLGLLLLVALEVRPQVRR